MSSIKIESSESKILISLERNAFSENFIANLLKRLRTEELIQELEIAQSIEQLGEDIKQDWWSSNKHKFIS